MYSDQHIREKLKRKTVGIAGCGGLGSNCAVALARVGVGKLVVADWDVVEPSNLNRQYFFLDQIGQKKTIALKDIIHKIDQEIIVEAHNIVLSPDNIPEIFRDCDVIVEAFDSAEMKHMIVETVILKMEDKPLVCGIGLAGWGSSDSIRLQKHDNIYICGDHLS